MKHADFLFELGCEELPSAAVRGLSEAFVAHVSASLAKAGLDYLSIQAFATPRRLALFITSLCSQQAPQTISRRGPAIAAAYDSTGAPTPALVGFAKSCGVAVEQLTTIKTDKGEWIQFEAQQPGMATVELLPTLIKESLDALPIVKLMRWGDGQEEFVRPVHWLLMLYGTKPIPMQLYGVTAGKLTYGHRFHHPQAVEIHQPKDYEAQLEKAYVRADFYKRRAIIRTQVEALALQAKAVAVIPDALLDEVTSIVEWPCALMVQFDEVFLAVPKEVLIASMQSHQKCFALADKSGNLLPHFITVANIESQKPQQVIAGNEKVMRARLSDAAFFFELDCKTPLSARIPATEKVIFQAKLGSLFDKSQRLKQLLHLWYASFELYPQDAERAAQLCKCDLLTGMVGEFPELQGLMGYYYARQDGESDAVAIALNEQYLPRFSADELPKSALGTVLSLADRLDTLVGAFLIGEKPTGMKDPFKLRRHALAVARLLLNNPNRLSLSQLIEDTAANYADKLTQKTSQLHELKPFILERLLAYYQQQHISADSVQAVKLCQDDWLYDFNKRLQALVVFIQTPEAHVLSAACKRVNNLLGSAAASSFINHAMIQVALLQEDAELRLFKSLEEIETQVQQYHEQGDYQTVLSLLATLREPVDQFFDQVMVLVDDEHLKLNRLNLLKRLQALLQGVADISALQLISPVGVER